MTRLAMEALLASDKYSVVQLAGAIRHADYNHQRTEQWKDDLLIIPVDGYGNPDIIRSVLRSYKPDVVWIMSDPRFYTWFHDISNEIRALCPVVWYLVWDNGPPPQFNAAQWNSNDLIVCISKKTEEVVKAVCPDQKVLYLPHVVDPSVFKKLPDEEVRKFQKESFADKLDKFDDKFLIFWNNRNARRKQSGTLIWWFKEFLDKVGHDKATLIMHTDPNDEAGQNLEKIIADLNLTNGEVLFSREKVPQEGLALVYNMVDVTVNISDAEGFGLSTLESLACGTPIIVNMTGGLQEQVTDGKKWFGIGIEPCSKAIIGSQDVPYIYEDRISKEDFIDALKAMYDMSKEERDNLGKLGQDHLKKNYNYEGFKGEWLKIFDDVCERCGSWDTRKDYEPWECKEL